MDIDKDYLLPGLQDARELGEKYYWTGKKCKNGHVSKRLTATRICVDCIPNSAERKLRTKRREQTGSGNRSAPPEIISGDNDKVERAMGVEQFGPLGVFLKTIEDWNSIESPGPNGFASCLRIRALYVVTKRPERSLRYYRDIAGIASDSSAKSIMNNLEESEYISSYRCAKSSMRRFEPTEYGIMMIKDLEDRTV